MKWGDDMRQEDIDLVNRVIQGDELSFDSLYQRYYDKAYYFALKIAKNEDKAQEAVQETFIQVHKSISDLKSPEFFETWLCRIVISKLNRIFYKNRNILIDDQKIGRISQFQEMRNEFNPSAANRRDTDENIIREAIGQLRPKLQDVIRLQYYEEMSMQEIAKALNISEGTVKSRIFEARRILKKKIEIIEKIEHRKIDFQSSNIHTSLFMTAIISKLSTFKKNITTHAQLSMKATTTLIKVTQVSAVVAMSTVTVQGAAQVYDDAKHSAEETRLPAPPKTEIVKQERKEEPQIVTNTFPTITYNENNYTSPKDVYFKLIAWAKTKEQIEKHQLNEFNEILPMYNALKENQGVYWNQLVQQDWNITFEEIYSAKTSNLN